jgi:ATP-binding cassette subfamily F protein 3
LFVLTSLAEYYFQLKLFVELNLNNLGKSTLLKLLTGDVRVPDPENYYRYKGDLSWRHPTIRIGHMTQYSVEELDEFASLTVVEYAEEKLKRGRASREIISGASGNVRQYLGAFGLGGAHAHRPIGKLSGGERMRLCFATVFAEEPHILCLDEATNHVDVETLDSMAAALNAYQGAVLMVSHNQSFLSGFCNELWVVEDTGHVTVNYDDTESFDELFSDYRNSVLSGIGGDALTNRRREKAGMTRRARQSRAGASQKTALL